MKFITFFTLFFVALAVADVFSQEQEYEEAEVAHHRSKRSPYDPTTLLLGGKAFLLGGLLGPKIFGGFGWKRQSGWGWAPVKVIHVQKPAVKVIHVSEGWSSGSSGSSGWGSSSGGWGWN